MNFYEFLHILDLLPISDAKMLEKSRMLKICRLNFSRRGKLFREINLYLIAKSNWQKFQTFSK